jgi:hypothetical protein
LHSAGKVVAQDIVNRSRELAEDPTLAVPECVGKCGWFCPFCKERKAVERIHHLRENEKALQRYTRRGPRIARAYAACCLIAKAGKVPYVAELKLGRGLMVPYASRGNAIPWELAGLQHYDNREIRLLSVRYAVTKRGRHVYSTPSGLVNTGKEPAPPTDFVTGELKDIGFQAKGNGRWVCEHGGVNAGDALTLEWVSANVTTERCHECAGDENTLMKLLRHLAVPNARQDFTPRVHLTPLEGEDAPDVEATDDDAVNAYRAGQLGDAAFIEQGHKARRAKLRERGGRAFVLGDHWFGEDANAFIDALSPTDAERRALTGAFKDVDRPVVIPKASATRALHDVWQDHGKAALHAAASGDTATADAAYDPDASMEDIGDALKRAAAVGATAAVDAKLPKFKRLPEPAAIADAITRAYRAHGADEAKRVAHQKVKETKERGVTLAFLRALGEKSGHAWKFTQVDEGMASVLEEDARALLDCAPDAYAEHLDTLARKAGSPDGVEAA